jgi:hypothetical protein
MMTTPGENAFLHNLEAEVEIEMATAEANRPDESADPASWLVDPEEAERDEVARTSLLAAVEALEGDTPPDGEQPYSPWR